MISRSHARIVRSPDGLYSVEDLNSTNGLFVNDRRVKEQGLNDGDIIIFGGATPTTKIGDLAPQPLSEFVYRFEIENLLQFDKDFKRGAENAFDSMKSLTENLTVIFTWISSLIIAGSYLFADEHSEQFSYLRTYLKPLFELVGVPFTRLTLILSMLLLSVIIIVAYHKCRSTKR